MMAKSVRRTIATFLGVAALTLVPMLVHAAADAAKEASTAARHAQLASKAASVKAVHTHLHHVVNCLVGPKGEGFDAKEADPCKALGNGAIPDATDESMKSTLQEALKSAQAGLASNELAEAKKAAAETAATLEKVK